MWLRAPVVPAAKRRGEFANKIPGETHRSYQSLLFKPKDFFKAEDGSSLSYSKLLPAQLSDQRRNVAKLCQMVREGNSERKVTQNEARLRGEIP